MLELGREAQRSASVENPFAPAITRQTGRTLRTMEKLSSMHGNPLAQELNREPSLMRGSSPCKSALADFPR